MSSSSSFCIRFGKEADELRFLLVLFRPCLASRWWSIPDGFSNCNCCCSCCCCCCSCCWASSGSSFSSFVSQSQRPTHIVKLEKNCLGDRPKVLENRLLFNELMWFGDSRSSRIRISYDPGDDLLEFMCKFLL